MTSKTLREKAEEIGEGIAIYLPSRLISEKSVIDIIYSALHQAVLEERKRDAGLVLAMGKEIAGIEEIAKEIMKESDI